MYDRTVNGFQICEWDNRVEKSKCEKCGRQPDRIFYRKLNDHDGEYWCWVCVHQEIADNIKAMRRQQAVRQPRRGTQEQFTRTQTAIETAVVRRDVGVNF